MSRPVIVCVDDEPLILEALRTELRNHFAARFSYETAADGQEALDLIADLAAAGIEVVLVMSDWLMPGIKGDEFLAEVHRRWPAIQAILVTGQADRAAIDRVLRESWAAHVVAKPWQAERLVALVSELCPVPS